MYMHVWRHLRFGALLRYAAVAVLLLILAGGFYLQFGPQAISYVSGFGKNQNTPLVVSNLPAQRSATVLTTGEDWKKTLDNLVVPLEEGVASTSDYQPTVTDDLIAMFLKEKLSAQSTGGQVDPDQLVKEYFKDESYGPVTLSFSDDTFKTSHTADATIYAKHMQQIMKNLEKTTTQPIVRALGGFKKTADLSALAPLAEILPPYESALQELLVMEVPINLLQLHKETAEHILNNIHQARTITESRGDIIRITYALSAFGASGEPGGKIFSEIMALK